MYFLYNQQNIKKSLQDENIDWIKAEQLKVKEQLKDIILEERPDALIVSGDIFH